jgi:ribosome biogenesis GTPase A
MTIQWFPGHMNTARREATETMRKIDVVIEVLDARVPQASVNPTFEKLRRLNQRPAVKLLNKSDVADPRRTRQWLDHYNAMPGVKAVALSSKSPGDVGKVPDYCLALAPQRGTVEKPLRMMILGIPNVGKSTLMNALLKRKVAKVADVPAVTQHQMRHVLGPEKSLVDTPGMLWPRLDQVDAMKLAATGSIGKAAYDELEVATNLGEYLLGNYRELLASRYGPVPEGADGHGLVVHVAGRRGLKLKGGELDVEKAAAVLLADFRDGLLGRVSLETPEQVAARAGERGE